MTLDPQRRSIKNLVAKILFLSYDVVNIRATNIIDKNMYEYSYNSYLHKLFSLGISSPLKENVGYGLISYNIHCDVMKNGSSSFEIFLSRPKYHIIHIV